MPTYEYKCLECGYLFEEFQQMTDEPLQTCPNCGGHVKRLIGAGAGPIFKGSGFYQTDYKSKSANSSAKTDANKPKKTETNKSTESKNKNETK